MSHLTGRWAAETRLHRIDLDREPVRRWRAVAGSPAITRTRGSRSTTGRRPRSTARSTARRCTGVGRGGCSPSVTWTNPRRCCSAGGTRTSVRVRWSRVRSSRRRSRSGLFTAGRLRRVEPGVARVRACGMCCRGPTRSGRCCSTRGRRPASTWTRPSQRALARQAAELGCELFVLDDGWFGRRGRATRPGLGDWWVNRDRFPGRAAAADRRGARARAWASACGSSRRWSIPTPTCTGPIRTGSTTSRAATPALMRNQLVLNLARPDVVDWVLGELDALLSAHDIQFVKWDMNRPFADTGWPAEPERQGRLWFDHVTGVYAVLDALRREASRASPSRRARAGAAGSTSGMMAQDGPVLDVGQHRCAGPAVHPARVQPALSGPHDVVLGDGSADVHQQAAGAVDVPVPRRDGRRAGHRRRPDRVDCGGDRRSPAD